MPLTFEFEAARFKAAKVSSRGAVGRSPVGGFSEPGGRGVPDFWPLIGYNPSDPRPSLSVFLKEIMHVNSLKCDRYRMITRAFRKNGLLEPKDTTECASVQRRY